MKKLLCFIFLAVLVTICFAEEQKITDTNSIFQEQQKQLNDMLIEYKREEGNLYNKMGEILKKLQSARDFTFGRSPYQQQKILERSADEQAAIKNRQEDIKMKTKELELKKNDLKLKVLEQNGGIPSWWDDNEKDFKERIRSVIKTTLK